MTAHRLHWPRLIRWFLKMDRYGGLPKWWQWFIPRCDEWGGPGWSAGRWNGDPAMTDWSIAAKSAIDQLFKDHDRCYQAGENRDLADFALVAAMLDTQAVGRYRRYYRLGAIILFTCWPFFRRLPVLRRFA